jgi:hypothetical protein
MSVRQLPPEIMQSVSGSMRSGIGHVGSVMQPTPGTNLPRVPQSHAVVGVSQALGFGRPHTKLPHQAGTLNQAPPVLVQSGASHIVCAASQAALVA